MLRLCFLLALPLVFAEDKENKTLRPPDDCSDSDEKCKEWAEGGECTKNQSWMGKNCQKSCDTCKSGWGPYDWVSYDDSFEIAKKQKKPIFLLIHKNWCPACKALKKTFSKAKELIKLSKYFVMINAQDDEEPESEEYKIDGSYVPRIYFLDTNGDVLKEIFNTGMADSENRYFYPNPAPILKSMRNVMKKLGIKEKKDEL